MNTNGKKLEYNEVKNESILEWLLRQEKNLFHYPLELTICFLSVALSIYHLYVAYAGSLEAHAFRSTHLAFILVLCFLLHPLGRAHWTDKRNAWFFVDLLLVGLTIAIQLYTLWDLDEFIFRRGDLTQMDIYAGTAMIILLLEATRRTVGWAMTLIALFFLAQTAFSDKLFWIFYGGRF